MYNPKLTIVVLLIFFGFATPLLSQSIFHVPKDNPIELGKVNWHRNYDEALALAEKLNKPVFILFQEVPGCSTCRNFGQNVLSHPFIVESIESHFVPLAIYNNVEGHDQQILNQFKEPTWNNPVVRIIDPNGKELVKRHNGIYSQQGLLTTILNGISNSNQLAPNYLRLYLDELLLTDSPAKEMYLSMYCFWTGEKELAKLPGVFKTAAGFMHGKEVVKVSYNTTLGNEELIIENANQVNCGDQVYSDEKSTRQLAGDLVGKNNVKKESSFRLDREQKYYLLHSKYKNVPMTPYQAMKVNSAIGSRQNPEELLSPRQIQLSKIKLTLSAKKSFEENWYDAIGSD